jgi:hypothetical protein
MSNRRTGALLAVLVSLATAVLFAGCAQTPDPVPSGSPSGSPSPSAELPLGQSMTVGGFGMRPTAVRSRPGPVYDALGKRLKGHGIKITIEVAKDREADMSAGESTVPVATVVDAEGETVRMDDFLGMVPYDAQSAEYSRLYVHSYQFACIQTPGSVSTATLWFSLPDGFVPETFVIDAGAGQDVTWLLP